MTESVGFSHIFPLIPIMNFLAMVSMLLLIPGFWKTRIVALVALVGWIFLGNLLYFIGTIHWRGHTNDAPVLASILTTLWRARSCGYYMSLACFAHFTWQRLRPLPVRQLYDTRRRNNLIHLFLTLVLPLLWAPLSLFSSLARYIINEDFGPSIYARQDLPGFVTLALPQILGYGTVAIFSVLSLVSYWRMRKEGIDPDISGPHPSVRTRKLLLMMVINMPLAIYCACAHIIYFLTTEWTTPTPLSENIASLQIVFVKTRSDVDADNFIAATAKGAIITSLLAFYVFAWFGLGAEARNAYGEALLKVGRLISVTLREHWPHMSTLPFSWSAIALWKANLQQRLANALYLVQPNAPQITPYVSSVPPDDEPQVPASPTRIQPSNPVEDRIDVKRQGWVRSRKPVRRLSIHKPPLASLDPENVIPSVLDIPLRRISHHKPPFIPLAPPNAPAGATPGASGSTPPREEAVNNIRRQEEFAPRPRPRRLSYHKPDFVPLAHANVHSAMPNALEPAIPLAEIPMDIIGERNAVLQAESVVEGSVVQPPPSGISSSMAPPSFSPSSTATPAPPYQEVNSSLRHAL